MRQTSIRELKHATSQVLASVEGGETLQVTRRNKVVAVLSPAVSAKQPPLAARPNFSTRLKEQWGDRVLPSTATEMLAEERGS